MDDQQKKTEQLLLRVEPDVREHYESKARSKRSSLAHVLREVLYEDMQRDKERERKKLEEQSKGTTHGQL